MELSDRFEVLLGPGVMDQLGLEAVGIGAEVDKTFLSYLPTESVGGRLWRRDGAALGVATASQGTCLSIHIADPSSQTFALLLLKLRHSIQG